MKAMLLLLVAAGIAPGATEVFQLEPAPRASIELTVEKTGLLRGKKHLFTFTQYRGTLEFDTGAPERSTVTLSIDSRSITCRDTWLSVKDLRKVQEYALKDMLAAGRYPQITFRSSSIRKLDGNQYEAEGTLTIRDVSKPVTVRVSLRWESNKALVIEGAATVRLTDFALKPPSAALRTIGTRDEMFLQFTIVPRVRIETSTAGE